MPSFKCSALALLAACATIILSSSRACPFSFCWEGRGGAFRTHRRREKRPESFIKVKEQKCSLGASRQFHHQPPEEEKWKLRKRED